MPLDESKSEDGMTRGITKVPQLRRRAAVSSEPHGKSLGGGWAVKFYTTMDAFCRDMLLSSCTQVEDTTPQWVIKCWRWLDLVSRTTTPCPSPMPHNRVAYQPTEAWL